MLRRTREHGTWQTKGLVTAWCISMNKIIPNTVAAMLLLQLELIDLGILPLTIITAYTPGSYWFEFGSGNVGYSVIVRDNNWRYLDKVATTAGHEWEVDLNEGPPHYEETSATVQALFNWQPKGVLADWRNLKCPD